MKKLFNFLFLLFSLFHFLSAYAISDDAFFDWGAPIVEAGRTGHVYPIKYTKTDPAATTAWTQVSFDDGSWTDGFGPIANTGFGGVLGTTFDDVNDGEHNIWFRRSFTLNESFYDKDVWLAYRYDDEGINEFDHPTNVQIDGSIYNLAGQQIVNGKMPNRKLPKGIYITEGKKILKNY